MTATVMLPGFYRGAINLWVEDQLTEVYLRKAWNDDPSIMFVVGGGNVGVSAVLEEAEPAGLGNVFASIDRDFGITNRPDWNNPARSKRFVSSVHEVENHLLDADALAGCSLNTAGRTAIEITARLKNHATNLAWWMAGRGVVSEVRRTIHRDFPKHPRYPTVVDQATAEAYLAAQPWFGSMQAFAPSLTAGNLNAKLVSHHATVEGWINTGDWLKEFPGKELFRHVRDWIYQSPPNAGSSALRDDDLGKAVGEWQVANNRVPQELAELLIALKARAGVP